MTSAILITGGAGFIGSALVRYLIANTDFCVINVDKLTYAGNMASIAEVMSSPRHIFEKTDICDPHASARIFDRHQPDAVMHLAAESCVDRSVSSPHEFIHTNMVGTYTLLETARNYWNNLDTEKQKRFRFLHVSTDEVYGSLGPEGLFTEQSPYHPSSPYSATKAAADHLVRAWHRTYRLPVLITNCSNNYGPYQYPEKLIPRTILNALAQKPIPLYGNGENIRDWLHVEDHARALHTVLEKGEPGRTYNIGGRCEKKNIEVVNAICNILNEIKPDPGHQQPNTHHGPPTTDHCQPITDYRQLITFTPDRPGHDQRYAIDDTRIHTELGWAPQESFETGLEKTVRWYMDNPEWVKRVRSGEYRQWIKTNYDMQVRGRF